MSVALVLAQARHINQSVGGGVAHGQVFVGPHDQFHQHEGRPLFVDRAQGLDGGRTQNGTLLAGVGEIHQAAENLGTVAVGRQRQRGRFGHGPIRAQKGKKRIDEHLFRFRLSRQGARDGELPPGIARIDQYVEQHLAGFGRGAGNQPPGRLVALGRSGGEVIQHRRLLLQILLHGLAGRRGNDRLSPQAQGGMAAASAAKTIAPVQRDPVTVNP